MKVSRRLVLPHEPEGICLGSKGAPPGILVADPAGDGYCSFSKREGLFDVDPYVLADGFRQPFDLLYRKEPAIAGEKLVSAGLV